MSTAQKTRLNQLIAVEKGVRKALDDEIDNAYHDLERKLDKYSGLSRTYRPNQDGGQEYPSESTRVQLNAAAIFRTATERFERLWDVVLTKDYTNCHARADIVLNEGQPDEKVLVKDVPVTHLIWLEKQLISLQTVISKIPTQDPSRVWSWSDQDDAFRSEPVETVKTKKTPTVITKAPATDKHQADTELIYEDLPEGTWTTVHFTGTMPASRKRQLSERAQELYAAVMSARERANMEEVKDRKIGAPLLNYLTAE